jgi:hypothetical protein
MFRHFTGAELPEFIRPVLIGNDQWTDAPIERLTCQREGLICTHVGTDILYSELLAPLGQAEDAQEDNSVRVKAVLCCRSLNRVALIRPLRTRSAEKAP